jgi:hypothetical protein
MLQVLQRAGKLNMQQRQGKLGGHIQLHGAFCCLASDVLHAQMLQVLQRAGRLNMQQQEGKPRQDM